MLCFAAWGLAGATESTGAAQMSAASEVTVAAPADRSSVTYSFNNRTGTLTISGKGAMPSEMNFGDDTKIKKVVIKKGVTSVCDYAFTGCSNLKSLSLPEGLVSIGVKSFASTKIKKLVIPASVRRIGQCAFWGGERLKWITMPGDFEFFYEEKEPDEWEFRIVSDYNFSGFAPKKITFMTPRKTKKTVSA